jgi:hypothetical protein
MSEAVVCFLARKECAFLLGMIENVKKIIKRFTMVLEAPIIIDAKTEQATTIALTEKGLIAMVYYKAFNEEYPENPDELQLQKIEAVLDALRKAGANV